MPSCVYRRCTNYDAKINKSQGISYHMFPTNPLALREWIAVVREQRREYDWMPSKSSRICSRHFQSEHKYVSNQGRMLLRKDAIPVVEVTKMLPNDCHHKYESMNIPIFFPGDNYNGTLGHTDHYNDTSISKNHCNDTSISKNHFSDASEVEEIVVLPTIEVPTLCIDNTHRKKRKYQRKKKTRIPEKKRLNKKCSSMAVILKILKKRKLISHAQYTKLNLKTKILDLININHRTKKIKKKSVKYPLFLRKFALSLNFCSAAAYNYVRKRFYTALPHPKILIKWYQNTSASPGFTKQAFDLIRKKFTSSGKRILCNLVADKIPIRHSILWTGKKSDGLVDFGTGFSTDEEIATHVYVFILVALNDNWKMPVGYFFVNNLPAETRAYLISTCISKCSKSGAEVIAVTLDGCPRNLIAANLLGCNLSSPSNIKSTFQHSDCRKEVAVIFDPCHMIKLVRNALESKKVILNVNDKAVRWQLIAALNKLETNKSLNFAKKQTPRYIVFRNEIMRIQLSTQLFSRNIAYALELYDQLLVTSRIRDIAATVEFVSIFNDLFDILNSNSCKNFHFKSICHQNFNDVLKFLNKAKEYILSLRIYNKIKQTFRKRSIIRLIKIPIVKSNSNTGFIGFLTSIQSLKYLYTSYVMGTPPLLPYISASNLTQGNNEIFFGLTRIACGSNKNLNTTQFKDVYRKIFNLLQLLPSSMCGHCISLEHIPILPYSLSAVENINFSTGLRGFDDDDDIVDIITHNDERIVTNVGILVDIINKEHCAESVQLIIGYISSWIATKLLRIIKCGTCVDALYANRKMWYHKLISISDMNGLCFSSENLFTVCLKSESVIKTYIQENGIHVVNDQSVKKLKIRSMKNFIGSNIFESLDEHSREQVPAFNHQLHLIQSIIDEFTNIRIRFTHKNNSELKNKLEAKGNRKFCLL